MTAMPVQHAADGIDSALELPPGAPPAALRPTFAEVYDEHFAFAWRSAKHLGTPDAHVDDVLQETFVIVHRRLASFEGRSSVKTWLFGILVNVVRAQRRRLRVAATESTADPEDVADPAAGPQESAARAEAVRIVDRILDALDDDQRAVFVLAELEQMSAPDIATALGAPLNTVYSRLRLARAAFAEAARRHRARDEWRAR
jgi:RNA polymerase sigma-70 factor (ECF subfamily)